MVYKVDELNRTMSGKANLNSCSKKIKDIVNGEFKTASELNGPYVFH